jgi:hypothetical protein
MSFCFVSHALLLAGTSDQVATVLITHELSVDPSSSHPPLRAADEEMFTATENIQFSPHMPAEVFACTVGQKPSKAPFYVNDPADVVATLNKLAEARAATPTAASPSVSFA